MTRTAVVTSPTDTPERLKELRAYMPGNYRVVALGAAGTFIHGEDSAGWTLDDYVIPRLASGNIFAHEAEPDAERDKIIERKVLIDAAIEVDADGFDSEVRYAGPGRFEGNPDKPLAVALDILAGVSGQDEEGGDIEGPDGHLLRFGRFVLKTDAQGFKTLIPCENEQQAVEFMAEVEAEPQSEREVRSYRVMVLADDSGKFCGNSLRYASESEAEEAARDLAARWTLVREWRVDVSEDDPNVLPSLDRATGEGRR